MGSSPSRINRARVQALAPQDGNLYRAVFANSAGAVATAAARLTVDYRETLAGRRQALTVPTGAGVSLTRAETFGDVAEGQLALIVDSSGWAAVVLNRGSAAEALGVTAGEPITLRAATVG